MRQKILVDPFIPKQKLTVHKPRQIESRPETEEKGPIQEKHTDRWARFRGPKAQMAGIVLAAIVIGLLMPVQILGELILAIYAVVALVFKIKSKLSFMLACLMLVFVTVLLIIEPSKTMAMTFATYVFLLLIIGTISLALEVRRGEHDKPKHPGLRLNDQD